MNEQSVSLLGVRINPLTIPELNARVAAVVEEGGKRVIANYNLHALYLYYHDAMMRKFFASVDCAHIDGMSLVFLGRLLGLPLSRAQRVTYVDWVGPLMAEAARQGWRIFYLGSRPGVADKGAEKLRATYPSLNIQTSHGYFDIRPGSAENAAVIKRIDAFRPHVLLVGMGMPRQEYWVLENIEHLDCKAILTAGACMDFVAGAIPTPPRWMGRCGLEWLYRLFSDPARLWRRYLLEPWFVLRLVWAEWRGRGLRP